MAARTGTTQAAKKKAATKTAYVVLKALVLSDAARAAIGLTSHGATMLWLPVLNETAEQGPDGQVRVIMASGQPAAIRQVTGPDGPDVVEGTWKAVALASWRGGETTVRTMKSDRLPLDEDLAE